MNLFLFVVALSVAVSQVAAAQRVVCYHTNWSAYGNEPFKIDNINATLCTHIVYSFLGLDENGYIKSLDSWNDFGDEWTEGNLKKFKKLKNSANVKLLLGVGGWSQGAVNFQAMVRSPEKRKNFLMNSVDFIRMYGLDGIEIDWVYQDTWGGTPEDKAGFSTLIKEMKPVFNQSNYVLGISTSAHLRVITNSYDIPTLSHNVDYINVMTYDYHGSWDSKTGHVAPLYPMRTEVDDQRLNNVAATINKYLELGAKPEKLNVGLISYGRTFTLVSPVNRGMNAPAKGPGRVEPLPYRTFCVQDNSKIWEKNWEQEQKVPFAYHDDQWVGYEDVKSLTEKVKFVKSKNLGGVSFWSLDMDDFKGRCGSVKFPLLRTVQELMSKN